MKESHDLLKLTITMAFIFIVLRYVLHQQTCEEFAESYRKVSLNMKIETITGQKKMTITGKNDKGKYVEWEDHDRWLFDKSSKIFVGDSIRKDSGILLFITSNLETGIHHEFTFECNGEVYK